MTFGRLELKRISAVMRILLLAGILAGLLAGCGEDSTGGPPDLDEAFRVHGFVHDSVGLTPIEGAAVTAFDSTESGLRDYSEVVTDSTGRYWIPLDFWLHGYLLFEKSGYQSRTFNVCEAPTQVDGHEYSLDVFLPPR